MSMDDLDGVIWVDGEFRDWREARVHILTHTLHYGMGVFEGIRAYPTEQGTAIFRLQDHIRRLFNSAHIMRMKIPRTIEEITQICLEVVRKNDLKSAYIRPVCFYGSEGMGLHANNLKTHVAVAAWEWGAYLGSEGLEKGIRVKTSSYTRHHVNISMCKAKASGNYINSMLALQEAMDSGYDEALMLDNEGYVAEGSGENIFIVRNGSIYCPDPAASLEGITRDTIITLAREYGYSVHQKRITRDEVYIADEAFFTGTAAEVTPIRELDNRPIGTGNKGPVTDTLQKLYFDSVYGRRENHAGWLAYV